MWEIGVACDASECDVVELVCECHFGLDSAGAARRELDEDDAVAQDGETCGPFGGAAL